MEVEEWEPRYFYIYLYLLPNFVIHWMVRTGIGRDTKRFPLVCFADGRLDRSSVAETRWRIEC